MHLLWKVLGDLKEPGILIRLFIPFIAGLVLVSLLGYSIFGLLLTSDMFTQSEIVRNFEYWQIQTENTIGGIPIIGRLLLWFIGLAVTVIAGVLGIILGSYLTLLFAMIITAFMTESLVKTVHQKHYSHLPYSGHGSTLGLIWKIMKYALFLLIVLLLTIPVLFIPVINIVWFWILGFLFFRYAVVLDVGQVILPADVFKEQKKFTNWSPTSALGILFALNILPLVSFFAPIFAVIALAHQYFDALALKQPLEVTLLKPDVL